MSENKKNKRIEQSRFYRVIWRWHFYAGLLVVPIILVASITGGLYVFVDELEAVFFRHVMFVDVPESTQTVSLEEQKKNALKILPEGTVFLNVRDHPEKDRAHRFYFRTPEKELIYVYVNQYNGQVVSKVGRYELFFDIVLKIHRRLYAGNFGRILVELATGWVIILMLTGLYLWIPRKKEKIWGVLLPRWNVKKYVIWRDWHNVTGFYLSILALIVLITGLWFTLATGTGVRLAMFSAGSFPKEVFAPPKSKVNEANERQTLDDIKEKLNGLGIKDEMFIFLPPNNKEASYLARSPVRNHSPMKVRQFYFDSYTGELQKELNASNVPIGTAVATHMYPIHVGSIFGLPTKILALLVCLVLIFGTISGVVMWWIRRPKGKLGALKRHEEFKVPKWVVLTICVIGILIPTVGVSIIFILIGDWIYQRIKNRKTMASL